MENTASAGATAVVNAASWNKLSTVDCQRNYVDRMSTAAQQQQRDCDREQHVEARAQLTYQQRQQQQDRDHERHQQAQGQQALHTVVYVPPSEFDEANVSVLNIGGKTVECQQCRAMIWPDEASRGHANLCCAKSRSCSYEVVFPFLLLNHCGTCSLLSVPLVHASRLPPYLFASTSENIIPPCRWPPLALTSSHPQMGSV